MTGRPLPIADGRATLAAAWTMLRRRPGLLAFVLALMVIGSFAGLLTPWALGRLVDHLSARTLTATTVWQLGGVVLAGAGLAALTAGLGVAFGGRLFETMLADLRERFVTRALALRQSRVEEAGTGDLISRAGDDIAEVSEGLPSVVPTVALAGLDVAVTLVGLAALDWRFAVVFLLVVPVYAWALRWYLRISPGMYAAERAAAATRSHHVLASLRGLDTVRAFGVEPVHAARIDRASWDVVRWTMRERIVVNVFSGRIRLAEFLALAAVLVVGLRLVSDGAVTVGVTTTAVLFLLRLFEPVGQLLLVLDEIQSAGAGLARIVGVTDMAQDEARGEGTTADGGRVAAIAGGPPVSRDDGPREGSHEPEPAGTPTPATPDESPEPVASLENVTFAYEPGRPVLQDVTLRIAEGERVALVGTSGAGKSTIAALLAGILPDRAGVRAPAATVLLAQETHVFDATLADNLRLARPDAGDDELVAALRAVQAHDLLDLLPCGLDEPLGEGGEELTAAQAQQVALARLVLADPDLAILDEATAEADSADAGLLDAGAAAAVAGRASLVIAHRLSQAAACDRIVVVEGGRVVESGPHDDLVAAGGDYARLWRAWAASRENAR